MPELELLNLNNQAITILLRDYPLEFVNSIRRICLSEVPIMAIDYVYFTENNTVLYDEIIAHRLGLIPLTSDVAIEKYRSAEECRDCEGCEDCYTRLYVEAEAKDEQLIVYSGDLKSDDPDVKPAIPNIPIVVLAPGQRIALEAWARLGTGKEHAKWSAASVAVSKYAVQLSFNMDEVENEDECLNCISIFSSELSDEIRKKRRGSAEIIDEGNTSILNYCVRKVCKGNGIKIKYTPDKLILKIESSGALKPERIVLEANKILRKKITAVINKLAERT